MIGRRLTYEYPHFTVVCPQTGYTFNVRTLNVLEVGQLKGSMVVPARTPALINKIIWGAIEEKPEEIKALDEFKKSITLRDREALLYGIYYSTFGDEEEFKVNCNTCDNEQPIKVSLSDIFSINAYPGSESMKKSYQVAKITGDADIDTEIEKAIAAKNAPPKGMPKEIAKLEHSIDEPDEDDGITIGKKPSGVNFVEDEEPVPPKPKKTTVVSGNSILEKRLDITLPISKVHAIIKQPTLWDEERAMNAISFAQKKQTELINEIMVIERFEQYRIGDKVPTIIIDNREDILFEYEKLPPRDKLEIFKRFQDEFGQYGIDLKTKYICAKCGTSNELEVDLAVQFFRVLARY